MNDNYDAGGRHLEAPDGAPIDPARLGVGPILTVGRLREILAGRPDDEQVVLATPDWYVNVETVAVPLVDEDGYSDWSCVTLFPGEDFDSRQI